MARPLREEFEGALWHVTSRGNARQSIFFSDDDRRAFLVRLARAVEIYGWVVHAFVLMDNHFHALIETPKMTLSDGMKWLNSCWAMDVNRTYGRTGHLFGERFKAFLVDKEAYYLQVLRYIILNPVRARVLVDGEPVRHPADYEWSSYRATAGLEQAPSWLAVDKAWLAFSQDPARGRRAYRAFVDEQLDAPSPFDHVVGQIFLGTQEFIEKVRDRIESRALDDAHPRAQREIGRASAQQVAEVVCEVFQQRREELKARKITNLRLLAAWLARLQGQPLRAIARTLGLTSTGHVSDLVKWCGAALARDPRLLAVSETCRSLIRDLPPPIAAPRPFARPRVGIA